MELRSGRRMIKVGGPSSYQLPYHPLTNAEILSNVLANFTIDECKSLRLVNTTWNQELRQRWMEETVLKISLRQNPMDYDSETDDVSSPIPKLSNCPHCSMSMDNFLHQLAHPFPDECLFDGKPIRNLRTCDKCENHISFGNSGSAVGKFWNVCGQSLKYLHLNGVKFSTRRDARKLLFEMTPNLEKLKFTSCDCVSDLINVEPTCFRPPAFIQLKLKSVTIGLEKQKFPISWMTFFSHFPNIQEFELTTDGWDSIDVDLRNVVNALGAIRQSMGNQVLNMTHLHLNNCAHDGQIRWNFDESLATKLCGLQLPLSDLKVGWLQIHTEALARVMISHRATLQSLDVSFGGPWTMFMSRFQCDALPVNLKQLRIGGKVCLNWEFLKFTPNLEKLVLRVTPAANGGMILIPCEEFKQGRVPVLTRLTKLTFNTGDTITVPAETIQFLIKAMPKISELEMSVDTAGFKLICKRWKLREWAAESCLVEENDFVQHITMLHVLSKLRINRRRGPGFGKKVIHEGFLKMRNLSHLCAHFSSHVSAKSMNLLKKQCVEILILRRYS